MKRLTSILKWVISIILPKKYINWYTYGVILCGAGQEPIRNVFSSEGERKRKWCVGGKGGLRLSLPLELINEAGSRPPGAAYLRHPLPFEQSFKVSLRKGIKVLSKSHSPTPQYANPTRSFSISFPILMTLIVSFRLVEKWLRKKIMENFELKIQILKIESSKL